MLGSVAIGSIGRNPAANERARLAFDESIRCRGFGILFAEESLGFEE
jgi:hypothetical protein